MQEPNTATFLPMPESGILQVLPNYTIAFEPAKALVVHIGFTLDKPIRSFNHRKVLSRQLNVLEFKHHRANGGKFWTRRGGVRFSIAIPKSKIEVKQEEGMSYPKLRINGFEITLNVSGGSAPNGWRDIISAANWTSVNLPLKTFYGLIDAALEKPEADALGIAITTNPLDEGDTKFLHDVFAKYACRKLNTGAKIALKPEFNAGGEKEGKLTQMKGQKLVAEFTNIPFKVTSKQVDWTKTAELNGISVSLDPAAIEDNEDSDQD